MNNALQRPYRGQPISTPEYSMVRRSLQCDDPHCPCHRANGNVHCPAHEDRNPSLSLTEEDGKLLWCCHAGCSQDEVTAALQDKGLLTASTGSADGRRADARGRQTVFSYVDEQGNLLYEVVRTDLPNGKKRITQRTLDSTGRWIYNLEGVRRVLYRLPDLLAADPGLTVHVVEGEKCVEALRRVGYVATTNSGGAGKWCDSYSELLRSRHVVIHPDNDQAGSAHAQEVAASLDGVAASVKIADYSDLPQKGDVADLLERPDGAADLKRRIEQATPFPPESQAGVPTPAISEDDHLSTADLCKIILSEDHFAQDGSGRLYHFRDGCYREKGEDQVRRKVKDVLERLGKAKQWSSYRGEEAIKFLRIDAPMLWDRPKSGVVTVLNGLLDTHTRTLRPHSHSYLSSIQIPVRFDPTATCPAWDRFVATSFPDDTQVLPYELVAWLIAPDIAIQKAVLLLGEGSNGKSTFLTAVNSFLGRENTTALTLHRLEQDKFAVARLVGKLANICPDLPTAHLSETAVFKALTGNEGQINAEVKYGNSFEFQPFARLIFSANQPPRSPDNTHAFFRRWIVVPFARTFEDGTTFTPIPRHILDAQLAHPTELSGVLNRALAALPHLRDYGFTETQPMKAAWNEFRQETDPLAVWIDNHTVDGADELIAKRDLFGAYRDFCLDHNTVPLSSNQFGRTLRRLRPKVSEAQRKIGSKVTDVYLGIGLFVTDGRTSELSSTAHSAHSADFPNCNKFEEQQGTKTDQVAQRQRENNGENRLNGLNGLKFEPLDDLDEIDPFADAEDQAGGGK